MSGRVEICVKELEELKKAIKRLKELGINPKKASREIRLLAEMGKLTPDIFSAYLAFRRAKFQLERCAFRYVAGFD